MSYFDYLISNNSQEKSLKQAGKSFWVGIASGIIGLLFFVAALGSIYLINTDKHFDNLNEDFENVDEKLDEVILILKNSVNENKSIINKLDDLEIKLSNLDVKVQKDINSFNRNYFVIVSLLGGGFLEIIAVINFYQYGKILSKFSDSTDRTQLVYLACSVYDQLDDEADKKSFIELINKIKIILKEQSTGNNIDLNKSHEKNGKKTTATSEVT